MQCLSLGRLDACFAVFKHRPKTRVVYKALLFCHLDFKLCSWMARVYENEHMIFITNTCSEAPAVLNLKALQDCG